MGLGGYEEGGEMSGKKNVLSQVPVLCSSWGTMLPHALVIRNHFI